MVSDRLQGTSHNTLKYDNTTKSKEHWVGVQLATIDETFTIGLDKSISLFTLIFYYFAGYGHNLIVDVLRGTAQHREAMSELMRSQPKTPEPLAAAMKDVDRDAARAMFDSHKRYATDESDD